MQIIIQHKHQQRLSQIIHLAMVLLLAWATAYWVMHFMKPTPEITPATAVTENAALSPRIIAAQWFGDASSSSQVVVTAPSSYRLLGVFSPNKKRKGFAILAGADGKQFAALLHETFAPQVSLEAIRAKEVVIREQGIERTIPLEGIASTDAVKTGFALRRQPTTTPVSVQAQPATIPAPPPVQAPPPAPPAVSSMDAANQGLLERLQKRDEEIRNGH